MEKPILIGISGKMNSGKNYAALIMQHTMKHAPYNSPLEQFLKNASTYNVKDYGEGISNLKSIAFADSLKQVAGLLLGVNPLKFNEREYKDSKLSKEWDLIPHSQLIKKEDLLTFLTKEQAEETLKENFIQLQGSPGYYYPSHMTPYYTGRTLLTGLGDALRSIHPNIFINALINKLDSKKSYVVTDVRYPNEAKALKDKGGILLRIDRSLTDRIEGNPTEVAKLAHSSETALDSYKFDKSIMFCTDEQFQKDVISFINEIRK